MTMTFRKIFLAATLALSLAGAAFAEEPAKAPAAGAPAVSAPAAQGAAPAAATAAAPGAAAEKSAVAAPAPAKPKKLEANKTITIGMFAIIIAITMGVVVKAASKT